MRTSHALLVVGVLTATLLSLSAGWVASSAPDGLERVAIDQGFSDRAATPSVRVLPDYRVPGIADPRVSTALAGVVGVAGVLAVTMGIGRLLSLRSRNERARSGDGS